VNKDILKNKLTAFKNGQQYFSFHLKNDSLPLPTHLAQYQQLKDSLDSIAAVEAGAEDEDFYNNKYNTVEQIDSVRLKEIKDHVDKQAVEENPNDEIKEAIKKRNFNTTKRVGKPKLEPNRGKRLNPKSIKPSNGDTTLLLVDPIAQDTTISDTLKTEEKKLAEAVAQVINNQDNQSKAIKNAINSARSIKSKLNSHNQTVRRLNREMDVFAIQWHKILSNSFACVVMFLIGAPLGAIIKRGGLGIPVLLSIVFFIIFYVINLTGEKWAKQDAIDPMYGIWAANAILFPLGLFFLKQARNDARLFDTDFYNVALDKLKTRFKKKSKKPKDHISLFGKSAGS
ncbi:MAG: LptF/LptG family permease, partial [Bacteroidota bacterium]